MVSESKVFEIRQLAAQGLGSRSIARMLGLARNTVKRYLRIARGDAPPPAPRPRVLDEAMRAYAYELFTGACAGNATAVTRALHERGIAITPRSVQRILRAMRPAPSETTPPPALESSPTLEISAPASSASAA